MRFADPLNRENMKRDSNGTTLKLETLNSDVVVRRARLTDVPAMMPLLNKYARQAEILPRIEADVYQSIREWVLAEKGGEIVGMGSLLILWGDLAEVRSLVVSPAAHGRGIGRKIVTQLLEDATRLKIPTVFALTRQAGFFLKVGFILTDKEKLPRKVMKDCVFCPKFHACDEIAVVYPIQKRHGRQSSV